MNHSIHSADKATHLKIVVVALVVGIFGGLFPAIRAARMPIVAGLYG